MAALMGDNAIEVAYVSKPWEHNNTVLCVLAEKVNTWLECHFTVSERIFQLWYRPMMNLFTSCLNKKHPISVSPLEDLLAYKLNEFQHPWDQHDMYAFNFA